MVDIPVVPSIEPYEAGYALRVSCRRSNQVWSKWHSSERNAYEDAVAMGMATEEIISADGVLATLRRQLKAEAVVPRKRLEIFRMQRSA